MPLWLDWTLTLGAIAGFAALAILANARAGRPFDPGKPALIPWRMVLIFSAFFVILALVHMVNLIGVETGPEHSPLMRGRM